jgi:DNA modification methylase
VNTLSGQPGNWPAYEIVDIGKLKPAKRNARTHSDPQIDAVADSMREFSQIQTIVVDANYRIVAGHARWEAAKRLGLTRVAILRVEHLSEDQLRLYAIADNRIAELAGWANDILAVEFNELQVALPEINLSVSGFELPRIDVLTSKLEQTSWSDLDEVDEPSDEKHPISVAGDIWDFDDKHVLGNSDSTDAEFVRRVVGDEQVAVVATDPPFNLQGHEYSGNGRHQHGNFMQGAGEMSPEQFTAWLAAAIAAVRVLLAPGALLYMFMDWKHVRELLGAADRNGLTLLNICIWDKGKGGMGAFYRSAHEMVFVFRHGDAKHNNRIQLGRHGRDRTNLWRYEGMNRFGRGRDRALSMHATIKPVQMICDLLLDCTEKGDLIFDGFGGSGTSLIAAEKLGRRARIIELDPRYCDVIIQRYTAAFGSEPIHRELGLPFSEVVGLRQNGGQA